MAVSINIKGVPKVQAMLKIKGSAVFLAADSAIKQSGFFIQEEVVESIAGFRAETRSVDTGRFKNSVEATFPQKLVANVETNLEYAQFLEYGTSKLSARHHFRNSAKRNEKKIRDFVNKKIDAVL